MLFRILARILRRHALYHLLIPLAVGVGIEAFYSVVFGGSQWSALPSELLSTPRIVLYVGIFLAYLVVITILIRTDTNIGLEQLRLNVLQEKLQGAKSIFAVGTMRFDEWFDPAVQVYLATIFERKLCPAPFTYERILLLGDRTATKNLQSDYLDGYYAKCLIHTHKSLDIKLYFLLEPDIHRVLGSLGKEEKADIGFYPGVMKHLPDALARLLMWPVKRRRVRKLAVAVIEAHDGSKLAFRFAKHDRIISVSFESDTRSAACAKFIDLIKTAIYRKGTTQVQTQYDFTEYYS